MTEIQRAFGEIDLACSKNEYYTFATATEAREAAEKRGLSIVYGDLQTLLLDIDGMGVPPKFDQALRIIDRDNPIQSVVWTTSPGGNGRHYRVRVRDTMSPSHRFALQAMLGSDPIRELLYTLALPKQDVVDCLFEKPGVEPTPYTAWR